MNALEKLTSFTAVKTYLETRGIEIAGSIVEAALILVIGHLVARLLSRLAGQFLERTHADTTLVRFLRNIVYAIILVFVVLAALQRLGINTTSFAAVLGAAGLAIGLALQGSLSNFAAGVMIILMHHFSIGDQIEAAGQTGIVSDIQLFSSVLVNADGVKIIIPNGAITGGTIKVFPPAAAAKPIV